MESYNLLIDFIKKHTDDRVFLIDGVNLSVQTAIAREKEKNTTHQDKIEKIRKKCETPKKQNRNAGIYWVKG